MSTDDPNQTDDQTGVAADQLTDELARKYDPERLLKLIAKRAGRGEALEHSVRSRYEKRFGVDLGHVRVITGEFAEEFNKQRNAYAVTVGATGLIVMGNSPDKSMGSAAGQALLAHELTHVAQQARHAGGGLHRKTNDATAMPFAEEHEAEAEDTEHAVLAEEAGGPTPSGTAATDAASQKLHGAEALKQTIEKIKARVMEMLEDAMRNQIVRSGYVRRA